MCDTAWRSFVISDTTEFSSDSGMILISGSRKKTLWLGKSSARVPQPPLLGRNATRAEWKFHNTVSHRRTPHSHSVPRTHHHTVWRRSPWVNCGWSHHHRHHRGNRYQKKQFNSVWSVWSYKWALSPHGSSAFWYMPLILEGMLYGTNTFAFIFLGVIYGINIWGYGGIWNKYICIYIWGCDIWHRRCVVDSSPCGWPCPP